MNMNGDHCPQEWQTLAAARCGQWSREARAHVEHCENCAEVMAVAQVLQQEVRGAEAAALPSAGQVWWRAQIRARRMDAEKAVQPVRQVQRIAAVCALVGTVLFLCRFGFQVQHWLLHLPSAGPDWGESLAWVLLGAAILFVAAVSAGLGYVRHASK